ncbi:MAG TPA: FAD-dependent thymidylate synthase, partial [Candidatus Dormibacteraeota bacterium]|nr:FAD-dependent thymidylate synthase [Candidatus Dormibacteraeota bacterium]
MAAPEFSESEASVLSRYFTNLDRPVFALRNLAEVVKGALFSRYSRTEKSLRRVLLDEFINEPDSGFERLAGTPPADDDMVAVRRAEEFYERVLVGYGDDSVAELAGAHVAVEQTSTLAAKALEDSRIGISPLEKSTRYVRFDRLGADGHYLYYRGAELAHPDYEAAADALFDAYSRLVEPATLAIRERFPQEEGETDRAWKSATRAKALDLLRGLLPAGTLTNLGLFGNGRAFEYLITKMAAHDLPECRRLAQDLHRELALVIPAFVRRALDERYGMPSADRIRRVRAAVARQAPSPPAGEGWGGGVPPVVRLLEYDPDAERKVVAAALFPHSNAPLEDQAGDASAVLEAMLGDRANRRQRVPRALEHAQYEFEIVANFAAYRDLHRHRMLTQDRQLLGTALGYDSPPGLAELDMESRFVEAVEAAAKVHRR